MLTKKQAIEEIIDRVNEWDVECLVQYVQDRLQEVYKERTIEEIESDYNLEFGGYDTDEDEYVTIIDTKASRLLIDGVKKCQN